MLGFQWQWSTRQRRTNLELGTHPGKWDECWGDIGVPGAVSLVRGPIRRCLLLGLLELGATRRWRLLQHDHSRPCDGYGHRRNPRSDWGSALMCGTGWCSVLLGIEHGQPVGRWQRLSANSRNGDWNEHWNPRSGYVRQFQLHLRDSPGSREVLGRRRRRSTWPWICECISHAEQCDRAGQQGELNRDKLERGVRSSRWPGALLGFRACGARAAQPVNEDVSPQSLAITAGLFSLHAGAPNLDKRPGYH